MYVKDPACIRSSYICVESLRNGFSLLVEHAPTWVRANIAFEDWEFDAISELWGLLVSDDELKAMLIDLQLRFSEGRIKIARKFLFSDDVTNLVVTCLLKLWQFKSFAESRWCTLGPVARTVTACSVLGLSAYVQFVLSTPGVSKYYLSGFPLHFTGKVRHLFGIVAISGHVPDAVLKLLLKDDRVPMQLEAIENLVQEKLDLVNSVSPGVWEVLGEAAGMDARTLCHETVAASLASTGHIQESLRAVVRPPWDLIQGDLDKNLQRLSDLSDPPDEEVTRKIWTLLGLGWNYADIRKGLELMRLVSWSSTPVEQAHSGSHHIMKRHKTYGARTMRARVMLHMMRVLFRQPHHVAKINQKVKQLTALSQVQTQRITGRHAFISQASKRLREQGGKDATTKQVRTGLLKHHGKTWHAMDVKDQRRFDAAGEKLREQKEKAIKQKKAGVMGSIAKLREEAEKSQSSTGLRFLMTSCRFTASQLEEIDSLWTSEEFAANRIADLRKEKLLPVGPPPVPVQMVLNAMDIPPTQRSLPRPRWLPLACLHRDWVRNAVLRFETARGLVFAKLCHALQSPYSATFVVLEATKAPESELTPANWDALMVDSWRHEFTSLKKTYIFGVGGIIDQTWPPPQFLPGALHLDCGRVVSDRCWLSLEQVQEILGLLELPADAPAEEATAENLPAAVIKSWCDQPWVLQFLEHGRMPCSSNQEGDDSETEAPNPDDGSGLVAVVLEALEDTRRVAEADDSEASKSHLFKWSHAAGQYDSWNSGQRYEALKIEAAPPLNDWLRVRSLPRSQSYGVEELPFDSILVLIEFWCHKMRFLFQSAAGVAPEEETFGSDALASYLEPSAVEASFRGGPVKVQRRIDQIRDMTPRQT
jgi:hypothetical protein